MALDQEIVQRIERQYVGEDCLQIMIPYGISLNLISEDGIQFHHAPNDYLINHYNDDARRFQFPYSNIPMHYTKDIDGRKLTHVNQLLEFEQPYILIGDGVCREVFAIKNGEEALLVDSIMPFDEEIKHMTYNGLIEYTSPKQDELVYYISLSGHAYKKNDFLPTEKEIMEYIRDMFSKNIADFEYEKNRQDSQPLGRYLREYPEFLNYIKATMKEIDFSLIDFNTRVTNPFFIIRIKEGTIRVEKVEPFFLKENAYKVATKKYYIKKYTPEELKYYTKYYDAKEPNISLHLNPGVTRKDLREAKQKTKEQKRPN